MRRFLIGAVLVLSTAAHAEPYLSVRTGLGCGSCHLNRTGGGGRTVYGAGYGAQTLPWKKLAPGHGLFDGAIGDRLRLGLDGRGGYTGTFRADGPYIGEAEIAEANVYLGVDLLKDQLQAYIDERVAPGGATCREAFLLYAFKTSGLYVKGGKFFLPFGLRFEDNDYATRRATGFTFETSDIGAEVGFDNGDFMGAFAVSNGTAGGAEQDNDKQYTGTFAVLWKRGRLGLSASNNDLPAGAHRAVFGTFGAFRAGPVVALAEIDAIRDDDGIHPTQDGRAAQVELDILAHAGLTVRTFAGAYDLDLDDTEGDIVNWGAGVDWTPLPGLQVRVLYRFGNGPVSSGASRDDRAILQAHIYF
ncbi:MAG TPA: hypothetical protein VFV19_08680 [Candidatus Polarisedimenticolaceae bacterium]|nr:hypothetical protein [Candidatus Polarisedimenticolaceae bacterium]